MNAATLTHKEIVDLTGEHTFWDWSVQSAVQAIAVKRAKGVYFWDADGKRYMDFNSQLMSVNIGHGDQRVIDAMYQQLQEVCYVVPNAFTTEARAEAGRLLAEVTPRSLVKSFFTNGGADAVENAIKLARVRTGRHKIISRYRSYHGSTAGAMSLTGEPRRWSSEPGIPGVVRVQDAYPYRCRWCRDAGACTLDCLNHIEDTMMFEGPHTIAAVIVEPVVGTNGILIAPDGYLAGLRELCTRHGIMLIADEVMSGFGRTGKWFAVEHWNVEPDIMTVAKGLTSSYVPMGATIVNQDIADFFQDKPLPLGLTYNSHALGCAAAVACIGVYRSDKLVENAAAMGNILKSELEAMKERHRCVGEVRSLGLFSAIELVKDRASREPLVPFNPRATDMSVMPQFNAFIRGEGVWTLTRWNTVFCNPPLCITEAELREGLQVIDRGLELVDRAVA
ncbi:MAG: aspartate aminotransferase family protein [Herpetosiphon sp.]